MGTPAEPESNTTTTEQGHDRDRLSVADAAARLGITHDAVRARVRRGSLEGVKEGGAWFVFLPHDTQQDTDTTTTGGDTTPAGAMIDHLEAEIAYLRAELTAAREQATKERERADVLQREALQRIEGLIPIALGPPGSSETAGNGPARMESPAGDTTPDTTRQGALSRLMRWLRGTS